MNEESKALWNSILATIQTEIPQASFITLFKNTALLSLEEDKATVAASSSMTIDLIKRKFLPVVEKAFEKNIGKPIEITFLAKSILNSTQNLQKERGPLFAQQILEEQPKITPRLSRVRNDYTFENLAVSGSNQLAFIAASAVSKNIGKTYNPLFIYGPTGVGKTHLMQAIANEVFRNDPLLKVVYLSSEEFTNEVVEAIRTNQTQAMKKRFRSCSLLLIDDVQFIAGKDKVQEELFHTFNILIDNSAQIVLSSDRPPHEIKKLEKRLSSRFAGGLTVDVEPPDFELKTAILLIKAKKFGVELPMEAAKTIAETIEDVRSLEGALLRLITESASRNIPISKELADRILGTHHSKDKQPLHLHPDDIINHVCTYYNIKSTQIKGPRRDASLVKARQIAMYLLKNELGLTFSEIGNVLGGRDHTTIIHGVEKVENLVKTKQKINEDILGITNMFRE